MADTIAVLSLKGGTGKTTTVRTLADVLRRVGLDVLTIDLDPQGNLSDYFDVPADASPTIADVLSGDYKVNAATYDGGIAHAESAERATSILDYRPDLGTDYVDLAGEVLKRIGQDAARKKLQPLRA